MKNLHNWINTALIVVVGVLVLVGGNQPEVGTRFPSGLSADGTTPSAGQVRGTTLTITGASTLSGAATLSSALSVSGATSVETLTQGGGVHATTSKVAMTTYTMVESEIDVENTVEWENNKNITLTLPATSTLTTIIPNAGDVRQYYFQNASTTAAATITFAAGTGIDLQFAEATGGDLVLNGLDWAKLTFIRQADTDVTVIFDEMTEAD